ncbi:MAG TPA: lipoyl(octanoyl) transferase LipB [Nevskiaceae bacterium]|nr:lipoyl(octanoyl) transferase LipB [Nevskiaceae bacterium]
MEPTVAIRRLGLAPYEEVYADMRAFTEGRGRATPDEAWFVEHPPVFTQGQAGKPEHVLAPGAIPVVPTNRGGQVTYHGPGQLVVYPLLDLARRGFGIRDLVTLLERAMVDTVARYGIAAFPRPEAPGVYVEVRDGARPEVRKLGSIGLRVSRGCSYHGIALNVAMDLEPFSRINPCGYAGLRMTQVSELGGPGELARVSKDFEEVLVGLLSRS